MMRAIVLERAGINPGQASALSVLQDLDDTGDASAMLGMTTSALGALGSATKGTSAGTVINHLAGAVGTGASLGAAMGSVIPGIGTVIGGVVGAIGGALETLGEALFKKHTRPLTADETAMFELGKRDPAYAMESMFYVWNRPLYNSLKANNQLPSRVLLEARKKGELAKRTADLETRYGDRLRAQFGHLTQNEQMILGTAAISGHAKEAYELILRSHPSTLEHVRLAPRHATPTPAATPIPLPVVITATTPTLGPATIAAPAAVAAQEGTGVTRALPPTPTTRPTPLYHLAQQPLPVWYLSSLLREVPALQQMPEARLQELAGYRGRANDVAGIDAPAREYVALPGETPAGIAGKLVDDASRAQELLAANPWKDVANPRWRLPPSWFSFSDHTLPGDTGDASDDSEPSGDTAGASDSERQAQTSRVVTVLLSDWPGQIAKRLGANGRAKWWSELKQANAHKTTLSSGEWAQLNGGELLNVPDAWPPSALAVAAPGGGGGLPGIAPGPLPGLPQGLPQGFPALPGFPGGAIPPPASPGPAPAPGPSPGPSPAAGTIDPGAVFLAQGELTLWAKFNSTTADPADFGQGMNAFTDLTGVPTARMTSCLRSFQAWNNQRAASPLRLDGVLDIPTRDALHAAAMQLAAAKLPGAPTAPGQPSPGQLPPGGGQGAPLPLPGQGGGFPPLPTVGPLEPPGFPALPGVPGMPPAPAAPAAPATPAKAKPKAESDDDSGIVALALPLVAMLGGFF